MNITEAIPISKVVGQTRKTVKVNLRYFPVVDGLRCIAVLAVICYHIEYLVPSLHMLVKGGFLGVDVFFVVSGFLITPLPRRSIWLNDSFSTSRIAGQLPWI